MFNIKTGLKAKLVSALNKIKCFFSSNEEVFTEIYLGKKWHSKEADANKFNSGSGSDEKFAVPYSKMINDFVLRNSIDSILDLGCGDFRVGSKISKGVSHYIGVDVVPELVRYHTEMYTSLGNVKFVCCDIVNDELPVFEGLNGLYLIRQVLQHLSNKEITKVLDKIPAGSKLIVTEHQQKILDGVLPNKDKIRGLDTRVEYNSAVFLDKPPFNFEISLLQEVEINDHECIRSFEVKI